MSNLLPKDCICNFKLPKYQNNQDISYSKFLLLNEGNCPTRLEFDPESDGGGVIALPCGWTKPMGPAGDPGIEFIEP